MKHLIALLSLLLILTPQVFTDNEYQKGWLSNHVPSESVAYIRVPNLWGLLNNPKETFFKSVLEQEKLKKKLAMIRSKVYSKYLFPIEMMTGNGAGILSKDLNSPIEAIVFINMPQGGMPLPEAILSFSLKKVDITKFNELFKHAIPGGTMQKEVDKDGYGVFSFQRQIYHLHFNEKTGRVIVLGSMMGSKEKLQEKIKLISETKKSVIKEDEKTIDQSGQGLFIWLNGKKLLPLALSTMPPKTSGFISKWGFDKVTTVSVGWGVVDEKVKMNLNINTEENSFLKLFPEVKNTITLKSVDTPDFLMLGSLPDSKYIKAFEEVLKKEVSEKELNEFKTFINEPIILGVESEIYIKDILDCFGAEILLFSDKAGKYCATKISNKSKFDNLLKLLNTHEDYQIQEFTRKGKKFYQLTGESVMSSVLEDLKSQQMDFPQKMLMDFLLNSKMYLYWTIEDDYMIVSDIPQSLFDRQDLKPNTSINNWLSSTQKQNPSHAQFLVTASFKDLPKRLYYTYLSFIKSMGDKTDVDINLFELSNAIELKLPANGSLGMQINRTSKKVNMEYVFNNNPLDFMVNPGLGLVAVSTTAILAGMLMPALGKAKNAANRTASFNNVKSLVQGVLVATNADTSALYRNEWAKSGGVETLKKNENGAYKINGAIKTEASNGFEIFSELKGIHPFGGRYLFSGVTSKGVAKAKYSSTVRIVIEIYDWENGDGDGKIAIGFADGHVELFDAPNKNITKKEAIEILSKRGSEAL